MHNLPSEEDKFECYKTNMVCFLISVAFLCKEPSVTSWQESGSISIILFQMHQTLTFPWSLLY